MTVGRFLGVRHAASESLPPPGGRPVDRPVARGTGRFRLMQLLHSLAIVAVGLGLVGRAAAATLDQSRFIELDIEKPREYWLAAGTTGVLAPEPSNGLAGIAPGNIGRLDYDFGVDRQGWYRLLVEASPHISRTEFHIDPASSASLTRLAGDTPVGNGRFQAGWVWLTSVAHRSRVQQHFWTGFPQIRRLQLEAPPPDQSLVFRVVPPAKTAFAIGTCAPLTVETGGNAMAFTISVAFKSKGRPVAERRIEVPPSQGLTRHSLLPFPRI